jgi:hypothetical protein
MQIQAVGNVRIDGRSQNEARMTANAESAAYDTGKDMIVVKGMPVTSWVQREPGETPNNVLCWGTVSYFVATGQPEFKGRVEADITVPASVGVGSNPGGPPLR